MNEFTFSSCSFFKGTFSSVGKIMTEPVGASIKDLVGADTVGVSVEDLVRGVTAGVGYHVAFVCCNLITCSVIAFIGRNFYAWLRSWRY